VLDSGFYPNWRDYFVERDVLTLYARAFIAAGGNQNANQWDVGSDPHGMATATITGYKFVDDTNEGGWGVGYATGKPGTYWVPGVAPGAKVIPVCIAAMLVACRLPYELCCMSGFSSSRTAGPVHSRKRHGVRVVGQGRTGSRVPSWQSVGGRDRHRSSYHGHRGLARDW
jgi:hypothetical protein